MIVISKAILHIMDFNSGATIYSGAELDMGAPGTYDFLAGHIDKLFKDASAKTGQFLPESIFSQTSSNYLDEHITFSDFSAGICKDLDTCLTDAGETDIVDVVVCDFTIETERYLGVMLYGSRPAYTHQGKFGPSFFKGDGQFGRCFRQCFYDHIKALVQIGANFEPADQNDANNKSQGEDQTDRTFDFWGPV